jgi:hypothetical protein
MRQAYTYFEVSFYNISSNGLGSAVGIATVYVLEDRGVGGRVLVW